MKIKLTDRYVDSLKSEDGKRLEVLDTQVGGLHLRVGSDDSKKWSVRATGPTGKKIRAPLGEYPLLLTTRCKSVCKLTAFKSAKYMRKHLPDPIIEMNPKTAQKAGIEEGEWVYIEIKNVRITHKLSLDADLNPQGSACCFWVVVSEKPLQFTSVRQNQHQHTFR